MSYFCGTCSEFINFACLFFARQRFLLDKKILNFVLLDDLHKKAFWDNNTTDLCDQEWSECAFRTDFVDTEEHPGIYFCLWLPIFSKSATNWSDQSSQWPEGADASDRIAFSISSVPLHIIGTRWTSRAQINRTHSTLSLWPTPNLWRFVQAFVHLRTGNITLKVKNDKSRCQHTCVYYSSFVPPRLSVIWQHWTRFGFTVYMHQVKHKKIPTGHNTTQSSPDLECEKVVNQN